MGEMMAASDFWQAPNKEPAKKTGPWDDVDVQILIRLWKDGHSNAEIATTLGRQENAVAIKASRLRLPPKAVASQKLNPENAKNSKARLRPCLCCQKTFFSEGPGHRVCDGCKSTSAWSSGDYAISFGGNF
ncbi:hypothetical protein KUV57_12925 [Epibacterium sp. DP7N7-1]|nr:hypothetical protein [Epibacterium sp. DP7N7-1]